MPQTLDFVRDCGDRWNVPIVWVEYEPSGGKHRKFRIVDHRSASRMGEPYEAMLRETAVPPHPRHSLLHADIRTTQLYYRPSSKDSEDAARHIQIR